MYNCIFSGHCTEEQCNKSCPILAQTTYLLDRNELTTNSPVFKMGKDAIMKYSSVIANSKGLVRTYLAQNTTYTADCLTYCAICENWKGSQLHCTVYNLKLSKYIEQLQKSWNNNADPNLVDYIKIWASTAKVLVISSIDFVNFKDFQSQVLLSILQERSNPDLTTIIVSPQISNLVGDGPFFARLTDILTRQKVV